MPDQPTTEIDVLRRAAQQIRNDRGGVVSRQTQDGRRWLPVADFLERAAEQHRVESVDDLYLWDCDECPEGDCQGHTRDCCWGCVAQDEDGYAGRVFHPCGELTAALSIARAYLGLEDDDA